MNITNCLPTIETASQIEPRSAIDIARRAVCLLLVASRAELDPETLDFLISEYKLAGYFTSDEQAFLDTENPKEEEMCNFSWRTEASWVLLWALGFVEELGLPIEQIDPEKAIEIVEDIEIEELASNPNARSIDEILDEVDLIYRCHWALRHAQRNSSFDIGPLEPGVTLERHTALNWLVRYEGQEWDDITTDT